MVIFLRELINFHSVQKHNQRGKCQKLSIWIKNVAAIFYSLSLSMVMARQREWMRNAQNIISGIDLVSSANSVIAMLMIIYTLYWILYLCSMQKIVCAVQKKSREKGKSERGEEKYIYSWQSLVLAGGARVEKMNGMTKYSHHFHFEFFIATNKISALILLAMAISTRKYIVAEKRTIRGAHHRNKIDGSLWSEHK